MGSQSASAIRIRNLHQQSASAIRNPHPQSASVISIRNPHPLSATRKVYHAFEGDIKTR
jgi:hypothetical protein